MLSKADYKINDKLNKNLAHWTNRIIR